MVQQTIVLKLSNGDTNYEKLKTKAWKIVATAQGSISCVYFEKEFMKVIGDVDAASLTMQFRKKKINAEIFSVETSKPKPKPAEENKVAVERKEEKKPEDKKGEIKVVNDWNNPEYHLM